ncbi:MAG: sensor histidine kinase [Phycisphaerales bacterium JB043]
MTEALVQPVEANPSELASVLESFNKVVGRLQETHEVLRGEVSRLNSELSETKRRLRRSQELAALGEMAAGIAHEIRNPLGSIKLYASMLEEDLGALPEQQQVAHKIARAVSGLDSIVIDVLDFARESSIEPECHDARDLFDRALEACRALVESTGVGVDARVDSIHDVWCDGALMHRALVNVIRNAVEATETVADRERTITLSALDAQLRNDDGPTTPAIELRVEDSGDGIPEDVLQRMFNPFFTTRQSGTGLGLAIVHRIVDAHNGSVRVSNRPEGGARVSLVLPVKESNLHSPLQSKDAAHENRSRC